MDSLNETQPAKTVRGRVTVVGGSSAKISLVPEIASDMTVGKLLSIDAGKAISIGVVTSVSGGDAGPTNADVDLLGEIIRVDDGKDFFQRGISQYPGVGAAIDYLGSADLRIIYDDSGDETINIGSLSQDASIGGYINVDEMLRKHFAVLGTTGVGKSSGVAVLMREILRARPKQRVFMIDPHNEYGQCFGDKAKVFNPNNLRLPHWLFNFEEMVDVIFRARPGVEGEVEILSQAITEAKNLFGDDRDAARPRLRKNGVDGSGYTVDTPVPYRMADVVSLIDARMGKLENRSMVPKYNRLLTRIDTVLNDPRYGFMFHNANVGGDTMVEVLSDLFNLPTGSGPVSVMQLAGFPAEVVDSVVSVVCRMAFELGLWSGGAFPVLVVCEEAHRYAPSDKTIGFGPTKKAVSRIAKEGRKYGVFLGLITQRPAELDATIVSQCSTLFCMRMANDRDQDIVRSAVSDAAAGLLAFVPSLGTREVFAFGEGVALPTRMRFGVLPKEFLPQSSTGAFEDPNLETDREAIASVIHKWRQASMSKKRRERQVDVEDNDGIGLDSPIVRRPMPVEDRHGHPDRSPAEPGRVGAPAKDLTSMIR